MTPLTLSSPTKATAFPIILWRCLAGSEHGITQPRPHDLRWVVRRAAGPKPSPQQANTVVIRRVGYGALGRLDRVRGVRFLRLTCRAADGPAQPEMTQSGRSIYAMKCSAEDFWSMIRTPPTKSGQSLKRCAMRARSNETRRSHHHEVRADNT